MAGRYGRGESPHPSLDSETQRSSALPLPQSYLGLRVFGHRSGCNPRLAFDRAANYWDASWTNKPLAEKKREFLQRVVDAASESSPIRPLAGDLIARQCALIRAQGGVVIKAKTTSPLAAGLGAGHVLENGFTWDRNLGIPYLPGSSIKGAIRAWAEQWEDDAFWASYFQDMPDRPADGGEPDPARTPNDQRERAIHELFGASESTGAGAVRIHDAFAVNPIKVELDVMTPHFGSYYRDPMKHPPRGDGDPVPVFFLAVPAGATFQFGISPAFHHTTSPARRRHQLDTVVCLFKSTLIHLGLGAKTAVGYGRLTVIDPQPPPRCDR